MQLNDFIVSTIKFTNIEGLKSFLEDSIGMKFSPFYVRNSVATGVLENGNWVEFGYDESRLSYFVKVKRKFTALMPDVEYYTDDVDDSFAFMCRVLPFMVCKNS